MSTPENESDLNRGRRKSSRRPEPSWLTVPAAGSPVPARWQWHYQRLLQLLEDLRGFQREHLRDAADTRPPLRTRTPEGAAEEFERDMLLGEAASEQDAIYEVQHALRRIQNGTYGTCELTGKPISRARLRAVPWVRFSSSVERALERNGSVHFQRLENLKSVKQS